MNGLKIVDHGLNLEDWFYYDETSPSGIRWVRNRYGGEHASVVVAMKGSTAGAKSKTTGAWATAVSIDGKRKRILCHRIVWELNNGPIPKGLVIDHIDRNPSNNSLSNLRVVKQSVNCRNSSLSKRNKTGVTGVSFIYDSHGYTYHVAHWYELDGRHKVKYFSTNKYGIEESLSLAISHRDSRIAELNAQGAGYTEGHGQ